MIPVSNGPIEHNNRSKLLDPDFDGAHLPATRVQQGITSTEAAAMKRATINILYVLVAGVASQVHKDINLLNLSNIHCKQCLCRNAFGCTPASI